MLTNAHLLTPGEVGNQMKGSPLRVRVETKDGGHSWHDASVLCTFTGEQTKLGSMAFPYSSLSLLRLAVVRHTVIVKLNVDCPLIPGNE